MIIKKKNIPIELFFILSFFYIATSFFAVKTEIHSLLGYSSVLFGFCIFFIHPKLRNDLHIVLAISTVLYSAFCILSCFLSDTGFSHETTKGRLISTIMLMWLFFFFSLYVDSNLLHYKDWLFYTLIIIGIVFTFKTYSLTQLFDGFTGKYRLGEELSGINSYGMYFSLLSIYCLFRIITNKTNQSRVLNTLMFLLLIILSATSGSRKALLGIIIGSAILIVLLTKNNKLFTVGKIVLIIAILYYVLRDFSFTRELILRISTIWDNSNQIVYHSDLTRRSMTQFALKGWLAHPLFGNGFNSFISKTSFMTYSHNNYAELLFNLGIVGTILFYGPKLFISYLLFKSLKFKYLLWNKLYFTLSVLLLLFDLNCVSYYDTLLNYLWWISASEVTECDIQMRIKNEYFSQNV